MTDVQKRISSLSPEKRRLLELLMREAKVEVSQPVVTARPRETNEFPLSHAQRRLWMLDKIVADSCVYNIPAGVRMRGALRVDALEACLSEVLRRHESLRTRFEAKDGGVVQVVDEPQALTIQIQDLSATPEAEREQHAQRLYAEEAHTPFNLATGPLLRAKLLRLAEDDHIALLTMHHIVSDAWSMRVLVEEVVKLYEAYSAGKPSPLAPLAVQYADYAVWQQEWMRTQASAGQLAYWKRQLAHSPAALNLPTDRPRPAVQTSRGANVAAEWPQSLTDALKALSRAEGATLFMTLLAAFQILLRCYTNQDDITVGTPIANRNRAETENLIGCFINTLALRTDLSGDPTFRQLLARVRETTMQAYAHQDLPFERIVEELRPERDTSRPPLFQVMLSLHNVQTPQLALPDLTLTHIDVELPTAKFDLLLNARELETGLLRAALEYNADLFDAPRMSRLLGHLGMLLERIVAQPDASLSELARSVVEDETRRRASEEAQLEEARRQKYTKVRRKTLGGNPGGSDARGGNDARGENEARSESRI